MLQVRPARVEEAAEVCDVLRRSIAELCGADHAGRPEAVAAWLANKTPETVAEWIRAGSILVAEEGAGLLGVAGVLPSGQVTLNYVAPEARFRGVSKALMRAAERRAAAHGAETCTVESTRTAERFYRGLGYRTGHGASGLVLVKRLDRSR